MAKTDKRPPAGKGLPARAPKGKPGANKPKPAGKGPKPRTREQAGR
jgi:hypothetical protein